MKHVFTCILTLLGMSLSAQVYPGLIPFRADNKWGYCDTSGNIKIKAVYDEAGFFKTVKNDSLFNPGARVKMDGAEMIIDPSGKIIVPAGYKEIREFTFNGFLLYQVTDSNDKKGIYIDGKLVIPVKYNYIEKPRSANGQIELVFRLLTDGEDQQIKYTPVRPTNLVADKTASIQSSNLNKMPFLFDEIDLPGLKAKYGLNSIRLIEKGLAAVEKNKMQGILVLDKIYIFKKNYTIISYDLLTKFKRGCNANASKVLIVIQVKDKYILMNENEKPFFETAFTDTEGNYEYVVVKDYDKIGFFVKNTCYPIIPTKYGKFLDPVYLPVNKSQQFMIFKVLKNGKEAYIGENGKEYFSGL